MLGLVLALGSPYAVHAESTEGTLDADLRSRLEALGYAKTVEDDPMPERSGVIAHDASRTQPGTNVYCVETTRELRFLDMGGQILKTIALPTQEGSVGECVPVPYSDGQIVVLDPPVLRRIDLRSGEQQIFPGDFHHDVAVGASGELYTFENRQRVVTMEKTPVAIRNHAIVVLSPEGERIREIDLYDVFGDQIAEKRRKLLVRAARQPKRFDAEQVGRATDVFHPNSIQYIEKPPPGFEGADLLLSFRTLHTIALFDSKRAKVVWSWGPKILDGQHHPTLLPNGNILVFDNGWWRRWSRVVEVDPSTNEIVWEYRAPDFYSAGRGGAYPLAEGNVLVTESTDGRVFEITRDGEVVWDFLNPARDETSGKRGTIYRMDRWSAEVMESLGLRATPDPPG